MKTNKIDIVLPSGFKIAAIVPENLDSDLVELALRAILGGFLAVSKATEVNLREYTIRYTASLLNDADSAAKSTQMGNKLNQDNSTRIIDDLLKSLHNENPHTKG